MARGKGGASGWQRVGRQLSDSRGFYSPGRNALPVATHARGVVRVKLVGPHLEYPKSDTGRANPQRRASMPPREHSSENFDSRVYAPKSFACCGPPFSS